MNSLSLGVKYILIAGVFFGVVNTLVKMLGRIPFYEIVFARSLVTLLICYYQIKKKKINIFEKQVPILIARGIFGTCALMLYFYSLQNLPLAEGVTLLYLSPIFTVIIAAAFNNEPISFKQFPFFILSFIGCALLKNFSASGSTFFYITAITAAVLASAAYNCIRKLKTSVDHHVIIFYFPFISIPVCIPFLLNNWVTPDFNELILLILIGLATQIAQVYMTKAYMIEKASNLVHFSYLTSLYAIAVGILFFDEKYSVLSFFGIALIVLGVFGSEKIKKKK